MDKRLEGHKRGSEWYPMASVVEWEAYGDRATALRIEKDLIVTLRPRFNLVHNNPRPSLESLVAKRAEFSPINALGLRR